MKTFQISTINGWEIKKIILAKQKSSSNETKINNNKVKKITFVYYLVNEIFMLLNTWIETVKHFHVKGKYTINKSIKKRIEIFKCETLKIFN